MVDLGRRSSSEGRRRVTGGWRWPVRVTDGWARVVGGWAMGGDVISVVEVWFWGLGFPASIVHSCVILFMTATAYTVRVRIYGG